MQCLNGVPHTPGQHAAGRGGCCAQFVERALRPTIVARDATCRWHRAFAALRLGMLDLGRHRLQPLTIGAIDRVGEKSVRQAGEQPNRVRLEGLDARRLGGHTELTSFVLARLSIDFRRELSQAHDAVMARCGIVRIGTSSFTLRQEIATLDGVVAAEGETVVVARDPRAGRSRPLTGDERSLLEQHVID